MNFIVKNERRERAQMREGRELLTREADRAEKENES